MPTEGETQDRVTAVWSRATPHGRLYFHMSTTELGFCLEQERPCHLVPYLVARPCLQTFDSFVGLESDRPNTTNPVPCSSAGN